MAMDGSNWMSERLDLLGNRPLNRLVMPASHDAAMYTVQDCVPGPGSSGGIIANACNTQTQTGTILDQLEAGARYFDVRPVLWHGAFHTGHYLQYLPDPLGSNGPTLAQFLAQVAQFMADSGDLVILKFSHFFDRDNCRTRFSTATYADLIATIAGALAPHLFTGSPGPAGLANMHLIDFLSTGGRVLCVYEELPPDLADTTAGVYSYVDFPSRGDLVVFDSYANQNSLAAMAADQKAKLADSANHSGNLFLLSWTLTQDARDVAACAMNETSATSILDLAEQANASLQGHMESWIADGTLTRKTMPNLIYVDANADFCLQTALFLNQTVTG
jgi:hypothetical protein